MASIFIYLLLEVGLSAYDASFPICTGSVPLQRWVRLKFLAIQMFVEMTGLLNLPRNWKTCVCVEKYSRRQLFWRHTEF